MVTMFGDEGAFRDLLAQTSKDISFSKQVGFRLTRFDNQVLFELSRACCFLPRAMGVPVQQHWDQRREATKEFVTEARRLLLTIQKLKEAEAWIETRFQVVSAIQRSVELPGGQQSIRNLIKVEVLLEELMASLSKVKNGSKPRVEDEANYYLYLMEAFLKWRYAKETQQRKKVRGTDLNGVIAAHVTAWKPPDSSLRELTSSGVSARTAWYRKRNPDFAQAIDQALLAFVKQETGIDIPDAEKRVKKRDFSAVAKKHH